MLTIITPCCRQSNLPRLYESICFEKIQKWIIVYDTSKDRKYEKMYVGHSKILEVECNDIGVVGHPQRNYGMDLVEDGFFYFLDDDNIIHPNFWILTNSLSDSYFYTFNQLRDNKEQILPGDTIATSRIDTAMFVVHKNHVKGTRWRTHEYDADGHFIIDILNKNRYFHVYKNAIGCYYNYLQ